MFDALDGGRLSLSEEDEMQTGLINQLDRVMRSVRSNKGPVECNEDKLVAEAKGGSLTAFEQLVKYCEARVFRLAQAIAHSREDAEEIMQSAFVHAFENLSHFRGDSRFYTWLVRITVNEGLMKVRQRRLNDISIDDSVETEEGFLPGELEDWGPTPEQRYSQQELQSILATTIGQLTPEYRTVFHLRDVEGLSTEETAEALALSISAVKKHLRRARLQLRQSLNKYFKPMSGNRTTSKRASEGLLDVLLINKGQQGWSHLAMQLEQLGCQCWFASTPEDIRALLDRHPFRLILSTRPVTEGSVLMQLLRGPERSVFYSFPVENGCLWFEAFPESSLAAGSAFRPSEFMSILSDLIKSGKAA